MTAELDVMQATYPPLNTLKPVANNVWIVDGPTIRFGLAWAKMPFPTRMTVVRLNDSDLFIHSPTPLIADLKAEVESIGVPRWIVGPNRIHYWWIPEWRTAFPGADIYLAPGIRERAKERMNFEGHLLDRFEGYPWDAELATLPIIGSYMTEVEFFHYESRTLILTDLIENFEPQKLRSCLARWLTWIGRVQHPDGQMPLDMRLTFLRRRRQLRAAVERMISWEPERVILAHGCWYPRAGADELRRAFRWVLR